MKVAQRRYFIIVAAFAAFAALFWRRLLFDGLIPFDVDTLCFYLPNWTIGRRLLETGSILWDPYRNFGQPFLAVPQAQGLYPLRFLSPLVSFATYTQISVVLHSALAAGFAFKLARRRGASDPAAVSAALAFAFAGPMVMRVVFAADFATIAWLPCLLYLLEARRPCWLGAALALQWFAGYPPLFLVSLAVLGVLAVSQADRRGALRTLGFAVPLAAGLTAAQSLPFLELMRLSSRAILLGSEEALQHSTHPIDLARGLLLPAVLHDAYPRPLFYRPMFYLGPFVTLFAVLGAMRGRARDRWLLGGAAVFFWLALGHFNLVSRHIPLLHVFRYQGNWVLAGAACLILLAAKGITSLATTRSQWLVAAVMAVDFLAFAWPLRHPSGDAEFITRLQGRLPGFDHRPSGRILHAEAILDRYPSWNWRTAGAWPLLKATLLPSYGTVFGLREGASHHNLTPRTAQSLRARLNYGTPDPSLTDVADIERLITISPAGLKAALPAVTDFGVIINSNRLGRAFVLGASTTTARIEADQPGRLAATATGPGLFVFSEGIAPGWRATVDGKPAAVEDFQDALMSVPLSAGEHRVEMTYRPASFIAGSIISFAAFGLACGWVFFRRSRPGAR